jgi:hypothetical protein
MSKPEVIEIGKLFSLSGPERYQYFLEHLADEAVVWSLSDDEGLAVSETGEGISCFNVWPHESLARACAIDDWSGYTPESIPTENFVNEWLPELTEAGLMVSVCPAPEGTSVELGAAELRHEILQSQNRSD